jgi:transcriptional regulator with XRE-family HTH domain
MGTKELPPLARYVKQRRHAAGMTQQQLAVAAKLSISVVTQLEQGAKEDPRLSTVVALAGALGVTVDELLEEELPAEAAAAEPEGGKARENKGVIAGYEAINILSRLPNRVFERERAFQIVTNWIRNAKKALPGAPARS